MKLVGKLKENVEKAENKDQAKELIAEAGMELTDEEMETIAGGKQEFHGQRRKADGSLKDLCQY